MKIYEISWYSFWSAVLTSIVDTICLSFILIMFFPLVLSIYNYTKDLLCIWRNFVTNADANLCCALFTLFNVYTTSTVFA